MVTTLSQLSTRHLCLVIISLDYISGRSPFTGRKLTNQGLVSQFPTSKGKALITSIVLALR